MKNIKQIIKDILGFYSEEDVKKKLEYMKGLHDNIITALEEDIQNKNIKIKTCEEINKNNIKEKENLIEHIEGQYLQISQLNRLLKPVLEKGSYNITIQSRKTKRPAHNIIKDVSLYRSDIKELINKELNINFKELYMGTYNADTVVKKVYKGFQRFRNKRYKTDKKVHNQSEYRESIKEVLEMIKDGKYTDCDFWAVLLYGILYSFEVEVYCCDVSINGTGHAIVLYRDNNGYLIPLETTMRDTTEYNFLNKVDVFRSYQCKVLGIFDNKQEYKIIRVR